MVKPNIVLIIAEELGHNFLGYSGNKDAETPFLDSLSKTSVTFTNHFTVHSKCVPSRVALFSGRYCHNGGHRTLGIPLQKDEISLTKILKENGYYNVLGLKNHTVEESIFNKNFDEHWTVGLNGKKPFTVYNYNDNTTSHNRRAGDKYADNYLFGKLNVLETDVCDYLVTERACDFIRNRKDLQPFFMDINFHYTHTPYEIMEPYYSNFIKKDLTLFPNSPGEDKPDFMYKMHELYGFARLDENDRKELLACYYGMASFLDNRVKEIYMALEESGQIDNTIFIFTSDHGDFAGQHGLAEKWDTIFSDCLTKIPLIVHYPKEFKRSQITEFSENIDILPMLLELTNIEAPYGIQGKSPVPIMKGKTNTHKSYVFAEGGHEKALLDIEIKPDKCRQAIVGYLKKAEMREIMPDSLRKAKMIRNHEYKLVYRIKDKNELYDMINDPLEQVNCYYKSEFKGIVTKMEKILLDHLIETEENLPFDPQPIS